MLVTFVTASTTLAEESGYKFKINFAMNSSNTSNSDVKLILGVSSTTQPLTNSYYVSGACVNIGTSNYQLTTASTTLKGFGIEWQCASSCTSLSSVYNSVLFYAGAHWGATQAHVVSAQSSLTTASGVTAVSTSDTSSKEVYYSFTGLTPTQLASNVYMPNQTETWYVRCFGKFNHVSSVITNSGVSDLAATIGNGKNLSLKGNGFITTTILAVAGSLVSVLS
ncbi:unnamed protein product [Moneuplotes crassus]|uniref:Uncharacterized protein n=1 Tax=Euplotes crassus TaxID=5936 RepID=A0AAD1UML4_EUPCR|nr:unnamed protein product [Moneuplotes crassus]